jgi:uncharacterized lipoprotein YmbA
MNKIKTVLPALLALSITGCSSGTAEKADYKKFDLDNNEPVYVTAAGEYIQKFANVEVPDILSGDWTFQDFDDQDDGKVAAYANVSVAGQEAKEKAFCVFSIEKDGDSYKGYYLEINGTLYSDDGSCDSEVSKIGMPVNQ